MVEMGEHCEERCVEALGGGLDWRIQASNKENWWQSFVSELFEGPTDLPKKKKKTVLLLLAFLYFKSF